MLLIQTTTPTRDEALRLARELVGQHLVAWVSGVTHEATGLAPHGGTAAR